MTFAALVAGRVWLAVDAFVGTGPLGPNDIDPDDARDRACEVTAQPGICDPAPNEPPPPSSSSGGDPGAGAGFVGQLLVGLLVVVLIAGIVWLVLRWVRDGGSATDSVDVDESDVDAVVDEEVDARVVDHETPPDRWRRRAAEHRAQGDYRESIRCEYRALVGDLARSGYVDEIPGRTSGEERGQIAALAPELGEPGSHVVEQFDIAADTFDDAWFGDGVVTASDDERFLVAERTVLGSLPRGVAARRVGAGR
ncbi:MAG: hypothetical protein ACJA14_000952 [Ilumatobacter sp.]|jgi:hypothetical protein